MNRSPRARRLPGLIFPLLALLAAAQASARDDQAPRYATLGTAQPSHREEPIEVVQVFWYGCPSCGPLEDQLDHLVAETPEDVVVRRMPAIAPRWEPHARAFYAAESIGALDLFHSALAEAMQTNPRQLMTDDELLDFAAEVGLDADAFRRAYHSPEVERQVQEAAEQTLRYGITGVPALIINGQYRTDLQLAGDQETMIEVSRRLIEQAYAPRSARGRNRGPR